MVAGPILVVDDEPIVRESIRDWLMDAGYQVTTAETGEEALHLLTTREFSIMVLDLRLPGMTGLAVLKKVKTSRPQIKTIIITAYPSVEAVAEVRRLGVIDCLIKPIAPDDLEKLIREALVKCERNEVEK